MKRVCMAVLTVVLLLALAAPALASYGAVTNAKVKLYEDPMLTDADGTLPKYTAVVVKETRSGIARIKYDGDTYYIPEATLSRPWEDIQTEMKAAGVDATWQYNRFLKSGCYVYTRPTKNSDKLRLKRHMVVWAICEKDEWTLVECNGYYGYIKTKYLEKKAEQKALTNAELDRIAKEEDEREKAKLAKQKAAFLAAQEKAKQKAEKEAKEKAEQEAQEQQQAEEVH